jgi:hypothetical protein
MAKAIKSNPLRQEDIFLGDYLEVVGLAAHAMIFLLL